MWYPLLSPVSLIKENCHNSRTSDDIDMKLWPVTKLDRKNKTTSKKFGDDVMSGNYDVIVLFPIFGQFGAIWKPDSGRIVCKTTFSLIVTFYLTKTETRTKKSLTQPSHSCLEYRYYFCQKCWFFAKKLLISAKFRRPWY